jgi:hypothetical protein
MSEYHQAAWCENCGGLFYRNRGDHVFCSDACKAEYERRYGDGRNRYHKDNSEEYYGFCENCGATFTYNGYANRGGKRSKRFCSDPCRAQWHRDHRSEASQGAQGGNSGAGRTNERDNGSKSRGGHSGASGRGRSNWRERYGYSGARTSAGFDPYEILGVARNATSAEIKKAYRALARRWHPDICHEPGAEEMMKNINRAYDAVK